MHDGAKSGTDLMKGSKTNSETIAVVNTNHEGMIVSDSKNDFFNELGYLIDCFFSRTTPNSITLAQGSHRATRKEP